MKTFCAILLIACTSIQAQQDVSNPAFGKPCGWSALQKCIMHPTGDVSIIESGQITVKRGTSLDLYIYIGTSTNYMYSSLLLGTSNTKWLSLGLPLNLPITPSLFIFNPNCQLLCSPDIMLTKNYLSVDVFRFMLGIIPNEPILKGVRLYFQFMVLVQGSPGLELNLTGGYIMDIL